MTTTAERFWNKVDIRGPDECWPWKASVRSGYGQFFYPNRYTKKGAHVVSYILTYGEFPKGAWVLHTCDNRICVNPKHLHLGTHSDNMRECVIKGMQGTPYEKLSIEQRREVRDRYNAGGITQKELAKLYGVAQVTIHRCIYGRSDNVWKDYV